MNKQQYLDQPTPVLTEANAKIIEAVKASNFILKDEHDSTGQRDHHLTGVVVYQDGDRQSVLALFDRNFSDYYCLNRIALREHGPAVTRDNCGGMICNATMDPVEDVKGIIENINWEHIEQFPALVPGQYFNFVLKKDVM